MNRGKIENLYKSGHNSLTNRNFDLKFLYDHHQYSTLIRLNKIFMERIIFKNILEVIISKLTIMVFRTPNKLNEFSHNNIFFIKTSIVKKMLCILKVHFWWWSYKKFRLKLLLFKEIRTLLYRISIFPLFTLIGIGWICAVYFETVIGKMMINPLIHY